ncbi:MAG TPA: type III-B CRISPR module-associated protein Cmr3 [Armatimonadota bacterium]|nr:type III-B CRISPR module-associated protein Cmr3 [Armatimonadota bacterium]
MRRLNFILTPADVTVFRDARPFEPGATSSRSHFPPPRAVAGAIRTWLLSGLGTDFAKFSNLRRKRRGSESEYQAMLDDLRACTPDEAAWILDAHLAGPLLCEANTGSTIYPAPFHLARFVDTTDKDGLVRIFPWKRGDPAKLIGLEPPEGAPSPNLWRPGLVRDPREWKPIADKFVSQEDLVKVLTVQEEMSDVKLLEPGMFYTHEPRLGIGMDPAKRSNKEGLLYTTEFLRFGWADQDGERPYGLRVDLEIPDSAGEDAAEKVKELADKIRWLPIGGEGRVTAIRVDDDKGFPEGPKWPPENGRFLTYLATPGLFSEGRWYPTELTKTCDLVSAVTGAPRAVSGWDVAAGRPLKTRFVIPAGAVYFWQIRGDTLPEDPHGKSICDSLEDRQAGWGLVLRGEWNYV